MEISKVKLYDGVCHVIFTGPNYFFFSPFYGYIAIAERTLESIHNIGTREDNLQEFVLYSGNSRFPDGIEKDWFELAERFIKKNEQKHLPTACKFERKTVDLNKCLVTVSYNLNRFG